MVSKITNTSNSKWTKEIRINLLGVKEHKKTCRREFMNRVKETWGKIYEDMPIRALALRLNAAKLSEQQSIGEL